MRARMCLLLMAFAALSGACRHPSTPADMLAAKSDPATLALLDQVGERASVVVVVRPGKWKTAVDTLGPIVSGLHPALDQARSAPGMLAAIDTLLERIPLQLAAIQGLDTSRPFVAGLYEPQVNELVLAAQSGVPASEETFTKGVPGVRHRLLLPASGPEALNASLVALFGRLGFRPAVQDDPQGRLVFALPGGHGFVALVPSKPRDARTAFLRVDILVDERIPYADDRERNAAWLAMLDAPIGKHPPLTPARVFTATRNDLFVVYLRPWTLRDLGTQMGTGILIDALTSVDPAWKNGVIASGFSEVAGAELLLTSAGSELDDLALAFDLDAGLRITACASLTENGARILQAAVAKARAPIGLADRSHLMNMWLRLDTNALLQAAATPPVLAGIKKLSDFTSMVLGCGGPCVWHLGLRTPFGLMRTLVDHAKVDLTGLPPGAASLAFVDLDWARPQAPVRVAVAATYAQEAGTRRLREALASLERLSGGKLSSQLFVEPQGQDQVVKIGIGIDPHEVFTDQPVEAPAGILGATHVDFGRAANLLGFTPRAAAVIDHLVALRGQSRLAGRALVGELLLDLKGRKPLSYTAKGDYTGFSWITPGAAEETTRGAACLREVTRSLIQGFRACASVDPDQRSVFMLRVLDEVQTPLACAVGEPDTLVKAKKTRFHLARYVAGLLLDDFQPEQALVLLDQTCQQGHPQACDLAGEVRRTPRVVLARVDSPCTFPSASGIQVLLVPKRMQAADLPTFDGKLGPDQPPPALAVDAQTRYERLVKVFNNVTENRPEAKLLVSPSRGGRGVIQVHRYRRPSADVDSPESPEALKDKDRKRGLLAILKGSDPQTLPEGPEAVILLQDKLARLLAGGRDLCFSMAETKASDACATAEDLARELDVRRTKTGRPLRLYLDADPDVPFEQVARVAGMASCDRSGGRGEGRVADLFLGPVPPQVLNRAKTQSDQGIAGLVGSGIGGLGTRGHGAPGITRKAKSPLTRLGEPVALESLPRDLIRRVIRRSSSQIRNCYEKELVKDPKLAGTMTVRIVISPKGEIKSATIASTTIQNKTLQNCVTGFVRQMRFPAPGSKDIVVVNYPFTFKTSPGSK